VSVYRAAVACRQATDDPDCPLSARARQLWANLASRVDWDGVCWPDVDTLAVSLGNVDHRTVQRATAELVEYGVVDVITAHGRGRRNTYRLDLAPEEKATPVSGIAGEKATPVTEKATLVSAHIGEVEGEVEEREREQIDLSTLKPGDVVRCPRRPTPSWCGTDCPVCGGHHHVHVEELLHPWWEGAGIEVTP
jgi:hypothetical protein